MALLPLAAFAVASQACNVSKFPETHSVTVTLAREWKTLATGENKISLTVHPVGEGLKTGGDFFNPVMTIPVELTLATSDGSTLAFFAAKDMNHTDQTVQLPGRARDCTRDVDLFDGQNEAGVRIHGSVASEYAAHYVNGRATNAWMIQAEFDLSDASGSLGHISATEFLDW